MLDINRVNANATPCDQYYNISTYTGLVLPDGGDFRLISSSPCIDAGDRRLPLEPDLTVRDMGAVYYYQPPVVLDLTLLTSSLIRSFGGSLGMNVAVENVRSSAFIYDLWTEVILPDTSIYGPILTRPNVTFIPGAVIQRQLTQYVPAVCPGGSMFYVVNVGYLPDSVVDADSVAFVKMGSEEEGCGNWRIYGWDDDKELRIENSKLIIFNSYPNPFNASTALSYKLQAASKVKLAVYDIAGREIEILADGFYPAGAHQSVWDASKMASGVYFARLQADGVIQTRKLLLVK